MEYEVFEIHGGNTAKASGWDFTVCRTIREAINTLESDLDDMNYEDEIKIIFKRYTQAQMDEVVFE